MFFSDKELYLLMQKHDKNDYMIGPEISSVKRHKIIIIYMS